MDNSVKISVIVERELFYNEESNFGIYGVKPSNSEDSKLVKLNQYGNISVKGVMPQLEIGGEYKVVLVEKEDKKYGLGYELQTVTQDIPTSIDGQKEYLSVLLTPLQIMNIYDVYEGQDVITLMKEGTFDYEKVKGLGEVTYKQVRDKILGNIELQEALVELSKYGLNYNMVSKLVNKYGSAKLLIQKVEVNPYILTEVDGIGFKKCDELALKMGIEKDSNFRIEACINFILSSEASNNGNCWVARRKIVNESLELLKIEDDKIEDFLDSYEGKRIKVSKERVYFKSSYDYEKDVFENIKRILDAKSSIAITDIDERIKKAEKNQGFEFTDEQKKAIETAMNNNLVIISGKAGTGKTTILKGVLSVLGTDTTYSACALSGKASQRIAESTGLEAGTIHRTLGFAEDGFLHNGNNPLSSDVVLLDEASMVNSQIFSHLISAVKTGSKFIIIGDIEQLEPIGIGNVLKDMIESKQIPTAMLTIVHRQALRSGILSTANEVREGKQFNDKGNNDNRVIGELKDLHFKPYEKADNVYKTILKTSKQYKKTKDFDIMNFQVIVPMKSRGELSTKNLNIELQKIFNGDAKMGIKKGDYDFRVGDKIIQCGNNYDDNVFNGTLGIIEGIDVKNKTMTIDFVGIGMVQYSGEQIVQIDMAYALTVHRVQGSQFDVVVLGFDYSSYVLLSRQLVYTALTRAIKLCILTCQNEALRHAIRTDKASKRNTFLQEMLTGLTNAS